MSRDLGPIVARPDLASDYQRGSAATERSITVQCIGAGR